MNNTQSQQVDISNARDIVCKYCGHQYFKRTMRIKYKSPIISETGQGLFIPIEVLICEKCGGMFDFDDTTYKEEKEPDDESSNVVDGSGFYQGR